MVGRYKGCADLVPNMGAKRREIAAQPSNNNEGENDDNKHLKLPLFILAPRLW